MKVLLLAAGQSKRMKPIEDKNFLIFFGKPLIVHQLNMIAEAGFSEIILIGGKHNLMRLKEVVKDLDKKLSISVIEQKNLELGMCGAVLAAKTLIKNAPVLIVSSNDVVELKAFKILKNASNLGDAESYVLGKVVNNYFPGGYLKIDKNAYVQEVIEKPEPGKEPSNLVNLVLHVHKNSKKLISYLGKVVSKKDDLYEVALSKMIKDGLRMQVVKYDGFWQPIKYPWNVHNVFRFLFDNELASFGLARPDPRSLRARPVGSPSSKPVISETAVISKNAIINGDVIIGERVKIFDGAVVTGPAYIGDDCIVATNALVRESHLGAGCIAGFSTEIARSFLGREVWTHSNYIGDSVIGDNVSFGAGTVTGNLRLDEKEVEIYVDGKKVNAHTNKFGAIIGSNVRVGVNTSLMPGVRIGSGSFIGAGLVIAQDIEENSFVRGSWELKISKNNVDVSKIGREEFKKKL